MVRAVVLSDVIFRVQCDFILGSDAQGCMIVLVGDYNNVSVTLLMNQTNSEIINVTTSVSCYKRVIAFDIEYDGQIGTLAVPGKLAGNVNTSTKCLPSSKPASKGIKLLSWVNKIKIKYTTYCNSSIDVSCYANF